MLGLYNRVIHNVHKDSQIVPTDLYHFTGQLISDNLTVLVTVIELPYLGT